MNVFTAKADAWRSAMTRGQQPASAPRFPGQDNEFFRAPERAWREAMTRGQVPVASSATDDHGGMTHKCDGCSDGAPCGSCGGNVSMAHPAYKALQWARLVAVPNASYLWMLAAAREVFNRASLPLDSTTRAMRTFLDNRLRGRVVSANDVFPLKNVRFGVAAFGDSNPSGGCAACWIASLSPSMASPCSCGACSCGSRRPAPFNSLCNDFLGTETPILRNCTAVVLVTKGEGGKKVYTNAIMSERQGNSRYCPKTCNGAMGDCVARQIVGSDKKTKFITCDCVGINSRGDCAIAAPYLGWGVPECERRDCVSKKTCVPYEIPYEADPKQTRMTCGCE